MAYAQCCTASTHVGVLFHTQGRSEAACIVAIWYDDRFTQAQGRERYCVTRMSGHLWPSRDMDFIVSVFHEHEAQSPPTAPSKSHTHDGVCILYQHPGLDILSTVANPGHE